MSGSSEKMLCLSDTDSEEETEDDDHFLKAWQQSMEWDWSSWERCTAASAEAQWYQLCLCKYSGHSRWAMEEFHETNEKERQQQLEYPKKIAKKGWWLPQVSTKYW
jgi:hypothetical protein